MSTSNTTGQSDFGFFSRTDLEMSETLARNWWAVALRGVLAIIFGMIAFLMPAVTMLSLVLVFGVYAVVDGVLAIVSAVRSARRHERWGFLVLEGIVDIAAGVVSFLWPGLTILMSMAGPHDPHVRPDRRGMGARHGRPDDCGGFSSPAGPWSMVARFGRTGLDRLRRPSDYRATDRRLGLNLVDRCIRPRLRRPAPNSGLQTSNKA
jgi:hypothetical protein